MLGGSDQVVLRYLLEGVQYLTKRSDNLVYNSQHLEGLYNILCKIDIESQKTNLLKMYELGLIENDEFNIRLNAMEQERQRLHEYYLQHIAD